MAENNAIWLKPKPAHIDENFEDFLTYLKTCTDKDGALYKESIKLLKERIDILIEERFGIPSYRHLTDISTRQFNVRLCGAWLLSVTNETYNKRKLVLLTLINNLIQICLLSNKSIGKQQTLTYKSIEPLLSMAVSLIMCKVPDNLNLNWADIIQPEDKKYALLYGKKLDDSPSWSIDKFLTSFLTNEFKEYEDSLFEEKGSLIVENGEIRIVPVTKNQFAKTALKNSLVENNFIPAWHLNLYSDKKSQIKESKKDDVEVIEDCIDSIVVDQQKCVKSPKTRFLKNYSNRDIVPIEVVEVGTKSFTVRTIDPEYTEITGKLVFENNLQIFKKNYPFEMWAEALPVGTRINATYNEGTKCFSLTEQFIDFIREDVKIGDELKCKYYREVQVNEGFYEFVSHDGYIVFVPLTPEQENEIDEDGYIIAKVFCYNDEKNKRGCIKASFIAKDENPSEFEPGEALRSLISDFIYYIGDVNISDGEEGVRIFDEFFIKEICYTLNIIQSRESNPRKRYKLLSVIKLLSVMAHFEKESCYVTYLSKYIKTLILFAQTEKDENKCIKNIAVPDGLEDNETITSGTEILKILSYFAKEYNNANNQALAEYIESENELISKTASLVQSYNRLKDLLEDKTLKGIKRQILEGLSLVIDGDSNLDLSNKQEVNFGEEDDTKEFKHSFLFAPTTAKEKRQEYTVCKAICGLMNNRGGVVYLGVGEDQDGLGRPVGLDLDLEELSRRDHVRSSLDDYEVYINRKGEDWLGETAWSYVTIKQDREYNIIKIYVEPYPYDVVYLTDGKTYLRKNNSTDEIKEESTIEDIRRRRQEALRKVDDKLINLQDAIQKGLKVRLLGYQSSNSEKTSNRIVEPFCIEDNEYVICYEPAESKVKMFRISRIDKVAVTEEKWTNKSKHKMPFIDIFHMAEDASSKKERIKIKLNLKLRAKNALCEMYPKATKCLLSIDGETWQFETEVTSLRPIMHFYLNYAESIEILDASGLIDELRNYISTYIPIK